jgi:WhiB family redox-sensing transcriptional regulator
MMRAFNHILPDDSWMVDAACIGSDPDLFFSWDMETKDQAREVCATCKVRVECLDYAMKGGLNRDMDGIWGGKTPAQRRRIRRKTYN